MRAKLEEGRLMKTRSQHARREVRRAEGEWREVNRLKKHLGGGNLLDLITGCGDEGEGRVKSHFQTQRIHLWLVQ